MIKPEKIVLENGMTVVLVETHQSPVVSINACFRVGSVVETDEEAGICHLIEHMIFKGTPNRTTGQIAGAIEAAGGEINAYTSFDETVYYCTVSSRYFEEGLNILSDAVLNPLFDADELEKEKIVVLEEMNRSHDNPSKVLSESLFKTVYQTHPYGRPIIGSKETVMNFSQQKLLQFYHHWYTPKNLVFMVAGDFSSDDAKKKILHLFKNFRKEHTPEKVLPIEPEQTKPRSVLVQKTFEGYYVQLAFPIPSLAHSDIPAIDLLSHILGEGLSSRLEQKIKEKKGLVDSVYTYAYSPKHPGLFVVGFTTSEKKVSKAATEILKEIFLLEEDKISHAELMRARTNIKSDAWYEKETVEGLARKYGYFETTLGDLYFDQKYYQKIDEIDPSALKEIAIRYFRPEKLNVAVLYPESSKIDPQKMNADFFLNSLKIDSSSRKKIIQSKKETKVTKLKNGLTLVLKENSNLPLVSIRLAGLGGLRSETRQKNGGHHLFAQTMMKGTKSRDAEQLAIEIEQIAASINAYSGRNVDGLQGDFLSEKLTEGFDLFYDVLLNPAFEKNEFEKEKKNVLEVLKRETDQLATLAYKNFFASLYPNHPYGMPILGTKETLKNLKREDLVKIHKQFLNPSEMVISVVGDFDADEIEEKMDENLGGLKKLPKMNSKLPEPVSPSKIIRTNLKKSKMQSHIVLGFLGTKISSEDRYAMDVLNYILAGQGGRLFLELRDKHSLAYSVTSYSQEGIERGFFSVYIATESSKTNRSIEGILDELKKIRTDLVSDAELDRAQKYIVGSYEIDLQKNSNVAAQLAFNQLYGLGIEEVKKHPEKILKVTKQQVLEIAQKYIDLERYVLSVVGSV